MRVQRLYRNNILLHATQPAAYISSKYDLVFDGERQRSGHVATNPT
jgi:hypothetical protein